MRYVIAYDIGTTGAKTCLFGIGSKIELIKGVSRSYPLYIMDDGGAEQDTEDWWKAMCECTAELFEQTDIEPSQIEGISFCSQMQGFVFVDKDGIPVHRPMSYMDCRATEEIREGIAYGLKIAGANIFKLIPSLIITGAVPSSVKDPVWKYNWLKKHEPDNFARGYKWLDVKDYLILRCTGEFTMTPDSAFGTLIYDTRPGKEGWSKKMCNMFGIDMKHLPKIVPATQKVGGLTEKAAMELGLPVGTAVYGGGGDSSLIGVGAGAVDISDTHIYSGTSGWVETVTDKKMVDTSAMIAAIVGVEKGKYNYFAEMETAGKCLEWVKDHLALDEIDIYLEKKNVTEGFESIYTSLYEYLTETVKNVPAGSNGVIFTPWLHGNRCPFEDPYSSGMFFNIRLETGKTELIRSVLEGVCYHLRWMLECQDRKLKTSDTIRFVGGGALSPVTCQILSDITGRKIATVRSPQNVGSVGAAAVIAVGMGLIPDISGVKDYIEIDRIYEPDLINKEVYDRQFEVFKELYRANRDFFEQLNDTEKQ